MAIVPNKADGTWVVDPSFCTHNRKVGAAPNGATTPLYAGEIVLDTATKNRWIAKALSNDSWVPYGDTHTA